MTGTGTSAHEWAAVVAGDPSSLASHRPEWVESLVRLRGGRNATLAFDFGGTRSLLVPMVRSRTGALLSFGSGWGMGGVVGVSPTVAEVAAVLRELSRSRAPLVHIRPNPLQAEAWFAAASQTGAMVRRKRGHVVALHGGSAAVWQRMSRQCRGGIRAAERSGLEVDHCSDGRLIEEFTGLYEGAVERWAARQNEPPALSRWRTARKEPARKWIELSRQVPGAVHVRIARLDGVPVAGSVVLMGNDAHETRRAVDQSVPGASQAGRLLAWRALEYSVEQGCRHHHLGETGWAPGLTQFKESFGAIGIDYPEVRFERLPLEPSVRLAKRTVKRLIAFRDLDSGPPV